MSARPSIIMGAVVAMTFAPLLAEGGESRPPKATVKIPRNVEANAEADLPGFHYRLLAKGAKRSGQADVVEITESNRISTSEDGIGTDACKVSFAESEGGGNVESVVHLRNVEIICVAR
jgi:hypothetical protein